MLDAGTGVGVRESDGALRDKLDRAIDAMKEDGSLNALIEKWFGPGRRDVLTGVAVGRTGGLNDVTEGRAIAEEDDMKKHLPPPPTALDSPHIPRSAPWVRRNPVRVLPI